MKIHSDILNESKLYELLDSTVWKRGVRFDKFEYAGSRQRANAFNLHLASFYKRPDSDAGSDRDLHHDNSGRRWSNGYAGSDRANFPYGASFDEWGMFLAALFDHDTEAIAGPYRGRDDFHAQTGGVYK